MNQSKYNIAGFNRCEADSLCQNTAQIAETDVAHLKEGVGFSSQSVYLKKFPEATANEPKTLTNVHAINTQCVVKVSASVKKYKTLTSETMIRKFCRQ